MYEIPISLKTVSPHADEGERNETLVCTPIAFRSPPQSLKQEAGANALDRKIVKKIWELWALRHLGTGLGTAGCDFGEYSSGKKKKSTKLAGGIQDNALPRFPREKMAATVNSEC